MVDRDIVLAFEGRIVNDMKQSAVPFTYRFLGLTLRLAFTKRRFRRVEESYQRYLTAGEEDLDDLVRVIEHSFAALRNEIQRIEEGQEHMKRTTLPCVRSQMRLYQNFVLWLSGFREASKQAKGDDSTSMTPTTSDDPPPRACLLPRLDQGVETTTGIKRLIADFVGVPTGRLLNDLRNLQSLLEQEENSANAPPLWLLQRQAEPVLRPGATRHAPTS
jgi:hypothetical protein